MAPGPAVRSTRGVVPVRIRMLTSMAGDDVNMEEGREYDVPSSVGKALCAGPEPRAVPVAVKQADGRETRRAVTETR